MYIETSSLPPDLQAEIANFLQGASEHTFVIHWGTQGIEINTNHSTLGVVIREAVIKEIGKRYHYTATDDGNKIIITRKLHWLKALIRRVF